MKKRSPFDQERGPKRPGGQFVALGTPIYFIMGNERLEPWVPKLPGYSTTAGPPMKVHSRLVVLKNLRC